MERWPTVDRALRRRLLDEVRRRQVVDASKLTPAARIARLAELVALSKALGASRSSAAAVASSDEPIELWMRMKARFRRADERR